MTYWNTNNLQEHVNLLKSVVDYKIKEETFEKMLYGFTHEMAGDFTTKQLELVVWALSKRIPQDFSKNQAEQFGQPMN